MKNSNDSTQITIEEIDKILKRKRFSLFLIRCFDIFASFFGIIFFLPVFAITSLVIRAKDGKPIIFKQERVGKNGKIFKIFKYRTMKVEQEVGRLKITTEDDDRITKLGRKLRKSKIDELPQLFNVLRGEMSFVGPRPESKKYVDLYNDLQRSILKVRPGITGLASLKYYDQGEILGESEDPEYTYITKIMPDKIELNIEYIKKMGFFYNIGLILKTIFHRRKKWC